MTGHSLRYSCRVTAAAVPSSIERLTQARGQLLGSSRMVLRSHQRNLERASTDGSRRRLASEIARLEADIERHRTALARLHEGRLPSGASAPAFGVAARAFLAHGDLAPSSRRSYAQTLRRLVAVLGTDRPVDAPTAPEIENAVRREWDRVGPATWNRHLAALRSFLGYCRHRGWRSDNELGGLSRRQEPPPRPSVLDAREIEGISDRTRVALRERCLWRLMYETTCSAQEALGLNVEDLELVACRAWLVGAAGPHAPVQFHQTTASMLARLVGRRSRGPVFLGSRVPNRPRQTRDLCPETGRARLSYRRAEELFKQASRGRTLHDLRRAALADLAAKDLTLPELMARSRLRSPRSLERYRQHGGSPQQV